MRGGIRTYTVPLPAGAWIMAGGAGNAFALAAAAFPVDVEFFDTNGASLGTAEQMQVGDAGGPGAPFSYLRIKSANAQTIRYHATAGTFTAAKIAGQVDAALVSPSVLAELAPVAVGADLCVQIAAANADRKQLIVYNPDTHTGKIYLRSNNTKAASAAVLYPGEKAVIECSAAVFCFNPEAGSVTPLISEVRG